MYALYLKLAARNLSSVDYYFQEIWQLYKPCRQIRQRQWMREHALDRVIPWEEEAWLERGQQALMLDTHPFQEARKPVSTDVM
jgi:hypothetical protein